MKENDSQQPKGAEPIRKSDWGLGVVCINGDSQGIYCQDQNKHSTCHIIVKILRLPMDRVGTSC